MELFHARYSKGQIKIQEMAFVLVGIMIFFSILVVFYLSIRSASLRQDVAELREDSAREIARKLSNSPEFYWADCSNCIDFDKALIMAERKSYKDFWDLDYLRIERAYPEGKGECTRFNYPECNGVNVIKKDNFGTPAWSFVSLCRFDEKGYEKCELGKIYASGKALE